MGKRLNTISGFNHGRRDFMKGVAAGTIAATAPAGVFGAAPIKGGKLIIGTVGGSGTDSLDPRAWSSANQGIMGYALANTLTEISENNELIGDIAESWEHSEDARTWKFQLRKGVQFHNGKVMTAEDVIYSINLHRGEGSTSGAKGLMGGIADIRIDGPNAIIFNLNEGNVDLPFILADFHLVIVPAGTEDFSAAVFTGPYRLKEFKPGETMRAVRNESYWKEGRAHVDEVEVLFLADTTAQMSGLLTGEIHVASQIDPKAAKLLTRVSGVRIENHPGPAHRPLLMGADRVPFNNRDLRLAVKYALDRDEILEKVINGYGLIANDHPIPPSNPFFAADIPQRAYDPDRAAYHLKKSGFEGRLRLSMSNGAFVGSEAMASLFQQTAAKAGLKVDIARVPGDGFFLNVWMKEPFVIGTWGGRVTADIMFSSAYKSDSPWNDTAWRRKDFDQKLMQARAETDFAKRRAIYQDMQLMIHEDGGAAIPFFLNNLDGVRDEVKGFFPSGAFATSGLRVAERVWLEG